MDEQRNQSGSRRAVAVGVLGLAAAGALGHLAGWPLRAAAALFWWLGLRRATGARPLRLGLRLGAPETAEAVSLLTYLLAAWPWVRGLGGTAGLLSLAALGLAAPLSHALGARQTSYARRPRNAALLLALGANYQAVWAVACCLANYVVRVLARCVVWLLPALLLLGLLTAVGAVCWQLTTREFWSTGWPNRVVHRWLAGLLRKRADGAEYALLRHRTHRWPWVQRLLDPWPVSHSGRFEQLCFDAAEEAVAEVFNAELGWSSGLPAKVEQPSPPTAEGLRVAELATRLTACIDCLVCPHCTGSPPPIRIHESNLEAIAHLAEADQNAIEFFPQDGPGRTRRGLELLLVAAWRVYLRYKPMSAGAGGSPPQPLRALRSRLDRLHDRLRQEARRDLSAALRGQVPEAVLDQPDDEQLGELAAGLDLRSVQGLLLRVDAAGVLEALCRRQVAGADALLSRFDAATLYDCLGAPAAADVAGWLGRASRDAREFMELQSACGTAPVEALQALLNADPEQRWTLLRRLPATVLAAWPERLDVAQLVAGLPPPERVEALGLGRVRQLERVFTAASEAWESRPRDDVGRARRRDAAFGLLESLPPGGLAAGLLLDAVWAEFVSAADWDGYREFHRRLVVQGRHVALPGVWGRLACAERGLSARLPGEAGEITDDESLGHEWLAGTAVPAAVGRRAG